MKQKAKTTIIVVSLVIVALIILVGMVNFYLEGERENERAVEARLHAEIDCYRWEMKREQAAIVSYEEYIRDNETMNAFYTLREINPFIKEQMFYLREYMKILYDNITAGNYEIAHYQFRVCNAMDKSYSENYSFYFQQIEEKYENMSWLDHRSVPYINQGDEWGSRDRYLFAIESDYDSSHSDGFELEYYTDELKYYQEQINYIYDIVIL